MRVKFALQKSWPGRDLLFGTVSAATSINTCTVRSKLPNESVVSRLKRPESTWTAHFSAHDFTLFAIVDTQICHNILLLASITKLSDKLYTAT